MIYPGGNFMILVPIGIVLLIALYYMLRGAWYVYRKRMKPDALGDDKPSFFLKATYISATLLVLLALITYIVEEAAEKKDRMNSRQVLTEDMPIDGHTVPTHAMVKYWLGEHENRDMYKSIEYDKPYMYEGIEITKIKRHGTRYEVTLSKKQKIQGFYCDPKKRINITNKGVLLSCRLGEGNTFEGVAIPSGLDVKHIHEDVRNIDTQASHSWKIDAYHKRILDKKYENLTLVIGENEKIISFRGSKKIHALDKNKVRAFLSL